MYNRFETIGQTDRQTDIPTSYIARQYADEPSNKTMNKSTHTTQTSAEIRRQF